jgi:putative ABC transport system permease protein
VRALASADLHFPFLGKVAVDGYVLGFTVAAALLTTVLFGLAPALSAANTGLVENLKEGGRGSGDSLRGSRLRGVLVVVEVALALLLAIGATLTVRSLNRLLAVDPGFRAEGVLTASLTLPQSSYAEPARRVNFFNSVLERLAAAPGVTAAGMVSHLPFSGAKSGNSVVAEGAGEVRSEDRVVAFVRSIDPEYFRALRVPLLRGRFFTRHDPSGPPVAIINDTLARRLWPGQDAVGKRFGGPNVWFTVVGVTGDIRNTSLADEPDAELFVPHKQSPGASMALVIRTAIEPMRVAGVIRQTVRELDRDLPVSEVAALSESISGSTTARRFSIGLLGGFAAVALLLAAVGIYGVVSYSVARRTREIGVRMALGAARGRIAAIVVGQALLLGAAGVATGLAASLALTRLLRSLLFGVSATDPAVFAAASLFLLAVCGVAAYLPARRAARVDPLAALRHE